MLVGVHQWAPPLVALGGLIAGRAIYGSCGLASVPAAQAYVAERTTVEARTRSLAALASSQGVGNIVGPAVAPLLIFPPFSLSGPLLIIGALSVVTLVAVAVRLPAAAGSRREASKGRRTLLSPLWRDRRFQPFILSAALVSICAIANLQMMGFLVIDILGAQPIAAQPYASWALMIGALCALLGQLGFIRWFRMRPPQLLVWGACLACVGNLIMAFASAYPVVAGAFALTSLGYAFARPGYTSGASLIANREEQGEVAGVIMSSSMIGMIFAPAAAMTLYHLWRPSPFLTCALLMLALCVQTLRRERRAPEHWRSHVDPQRNA
jgi:MFS family permease